MYNMGVRRQGMELQVMTLPDACSICLLSERFFLVWRMGVSARRVGMSKNEVGSIFFFFFLKCELRGFVTVGCVCSVRVVWNAE